MAKAQVNKMEQVRLELNKLMIQYVITKDESLTALINELQAKLDYFNYGIK
jgi:hypothetical protein